MEARLLLGFLRFLLKLRNSIFLVRNHDAKPAGLLHRNRKRWQWLHPHYSVYGNPASLHNPSYKCDPLKESVRSPDGSFPYTLNSGKSHWLYRNTIRWCRFFRMAEARSRHRCCDPDPMECQFQCGNLIPAADIVSIQPTVSIPELMQLLSGKSIIRYFPPKDTAGFATSEVSTPSLLPCPPASSMAIISFFTI